MSEQPDVASKSRSRSPDSFEQRVSLLEQVELLRTLSPEAIAAIHRELREMREDFEEKLERLEHRERQRLNDVLQIASSERLESERQRLTTCQEHK